MAVSEADYEYVCRLVRDDSALSLGDDKQYLVETRLTPLAEREGLTSIAALLDRIRGGAGGLRDRVVEALATNETLFFRDVHPFNALQHEVIPAILRANGGQRISIWSAAASTGQEAYSLAMLMREHFPHVPEVTILGTDISREVLERAQSGRYSQLEVNRGLPATLLVKYFRQDGREWVINDDIRRVVTFRQLNLAESLAEVPPMDIVFLRNILIYFDTAAKAQALNRVADVLGPNGYLFLGGAETTYGLVDTYERVEIGKAMAYRLAVAQEEAIGARA